jgi:hypothetical protein
MSRDFLKRFGFFLSHTDLTMSDSTEQCGPQDQIESD